MITASGPKGNGNGESAALQAGLDKRLSTVEVKARKKIEDWAKKLVDLSKRNRLLYDRATKRTTLTFQQPSADTVYSRLVNGGYYTFYRPPELPPPIPGRQREVTSLESELAQRRPLERELVTTQRDPVGIDRSLDAIERKARAEFEDRGTHVLCLAWNLLRWADQKSGEEQQAPLSHAADRTEHHDKPLDISGTRHLHSVGGGCRRSGILRWEVEIARRVNSKPERMTPTSAVEPITGIIGAPRPGVAGRDRWPPADQAQARGPASLAVESQVRR